MPETRLYYWPIPFRGQFIRAVLAEAGEPWSEAGPDHIVAEKDAPVTDQPLPFMAPPFLVGEAGAMAQMPAILHWLGRRHGLLPDDPLAEALTVKIVADTNDILDEVTLSGGREMWDADAWAVYEPRLLRWMGIFAETGRRHGLTAEAGFILGGDRPMLADIVSAVLWGTMAAKLPRIGALLERTAPDIATHARRILARPALAALFAETDARWGDTWCGGQIEASLRAALADRDGQIENPG